MNYTASSHLIAFPCAVFENSGIQSGDVIGTFTMDGFCAGRLEIANAKSNAAITVVADDAQTPSTDGFETGEPLQFKVYRPETEEEFSLEVNFDNALPNTGYFNGQGISAVSSLKLQAGVVRDLNAGSLEVYPNPSKGIFNLRINTTLNDPKILITDFRGSLIKNIRPGAIENGLPFQLYLTGFTKGVYFLKIADDKFVGLEKVVVQ